MTEPALNRSPEFPLTREEALLVLHRMALIRVFDERVIKLVSDGSIRGTTHPYVGQEAVAVGSCLPLRRDDLIISTHRGHGHLLAKGGDPDRLMAELFGKIDGYGGGRGGTQHLADFPIGHLGSFGITGGGIPIGTGAALSARMRRSAQVVVVFFGEGAANQGVFHESLNLAALWHLPVVYVCENNLYAMSTSVEEAFPRPHVSDRAAAYGMPGVHVDGMDPLAVHEAVATAVERARTGTGPTLVECQTYRFLGHSKSDRRVYRSREEEQQWRERDPIPCFRRTLVDLQVATAEEAERAEADAARAVETSVERARQSPFPDPTTVEDGVTA